MENAAPLESNRLFPPDEYAAPSQSFDEGSDGAHGLGGVTIEVPCRVRERRLTLQEPRKVVAFVRAIRHFRSVDCEQAPSQPRAHLRGKITFARRAAPRELQDRGCVLRPMRSQR